MAHTPCEVLAAYKEQHGIERNFAFLKDPLIVNDLFLKRPDRIEALGFILLTARSRSSCGYFIPRGIGSSWNLRASTIPGALH